MTLLDREATPWIRLDDRDGDARNGDAGEGDAGESVAGEGAADLEAGVLGTSLHGLLESDSARATLLRMVADRRCKRFVPSGVSFAGARQARIDRLADALEEHLDLDALFRIVESACEPGALPRAVTP